MANGIGLSMISVIEVVQIQHGGGVRYLLLVIYNTRLMTFHKTILLSINVYILYYYISHISLLALIRVLLSNSTVVVRWLENRASRSKRRYS